MFTDLNSNLVVGSWMILAWSVLALLWSLPRLVRVLAALSNKKVKWPGPHYYSFSEKELHTVEGYTKSHPPLFSAFVINLLGLLVGAALALVFILFGKGWIAAVSFESGKVFLVVFDLVALSSLYCVYQALRKDTAVDRHFKYEVN